MVKCFTLFNLIFPHLFSTLLKCFFSWSRRLKLSSTLSFDNLSKFSDLILLLSCSKAPQWFCVTCKDSSYSLAGLQDLKKLAPIYFTNLIFFNMFASHCIPFRCSYLSLNIGNFLRSSCFAHPVRLVSSIHCPPNSPHAYHMVNSFYLQILI